MRTWNPVSHLIASRRTIPSGSLRYRRSAAMLQGKRMRRRAKATTARTSQSWSERPWLYTTGIS